MNKVILIGRLTKDSELRYTASNMAMLRNTIAVDRRFKQQEGQPTADFVPFVAFGKTAEFISNYFSKGAKIALIGRIQTGSYDNAEGKKVYTTDVMVEEVEFIEAKRDKIADKPKSYDDNNICYHNGENMGMGFFPVENDEVPF